MTISFIENRNHKRNTQGLAFFKHCRFWKSSSSLLIGLYSSWLIAKSSLQSSWPNYDSAICFQNWVQFTLKIANSIVFHKFVKSHGVMSLWFFWWSLITNILEWLHFCGNLSNFHQMTALTTACPLTRDAAGNSDKRIKYNYIQYHCHLNPNLFILKLLQKTCL